MGSDEQSLLRTAGRRASDLAHLLQRQRGDLVAGRGGGVEAGRVALERSIDSAARLVQSIDRALAGASPPTEEPER